MKADLMKSFSIFNLESEQKHGGIYRGIMEIIARFGYISIREVMYLFDLPIQKAIDRLAYLYRSELVRKFESGTVPTHFYCLTQQGKLAIEWFHLCDEMRDFQPARDYNLIYQHHDRTLVRCYIALRKIFRNDLLGWVSETQLKKEYTGVGKRVMDGEFYLQVYKQQVKKEGAGGDYVNVGEAVGEKWKCGFELELTIKSQERYRKQFKALEDQIQKTDGAENIKSLLFFYGSSAISDRLREQVLKYHFGRCVFYFVSLDDFFVNLGESKVDRVIQDSKKEVLAKEINQLKVLI
jgi:hypothetical protein